jgi:GNAT superfamily N-acetyltransferase
LGRQEHMRDLIQNRVLDEADTSLLETFLALHRDSSMFLRANMRRAGLTYQGAPGQATYVGAFRDGRMVGVAAHCWNGMVLLQAPEHAAELARAAVEWSRRPVTGLSGPLEQVGRARSELDLDSADVALDGAERLYALDLSQLVVPDPLSKGTVVCRPPRPEERDALCAWRLAYDMELLGATDSPSTRKRSAKFLDAQIAEGNAWVAVVENTPVSLSAFNAALPDIVQLGGIYTPPALRGRGFAKSVVAASLLVARDRGASRAVLFTSNPSAVRTYEAVGFSRIGDYSLVLLR